MSIQQWRDEYEKSRKVHSQALDEILEVENQRERK